MHGPESIAACNRLVDHCSSQLTGQPLVAYCNSSAAASSCLSALFRGSIWPTNLLVGFLCVAVSEVVSLGLWLYLLSVVDSLVSDVGCCRSRVFLFDGLGGTLMSWRCFLIGFVLGGTGKL